MRRSCNAGAHEAIALHYQVGPQAQRLSGRPLTVVAVARPALTARQAVREIRVHVVFAVLRCGVALQDASANRYQKMQEPPPRRLARQRPLRSPPARGWEDWKAGTILKCMAQLAL